MSVTEKPSKASNFVFVFFLKKPFHKIISGSGGSSIWSETSNKQSRASDRSRKKKSNFAGFLETNSRKNRPISREFRGNFRGKPHQKAIGKKGAIFWLFSWQISLEIDQFGADQTSINEPMAKPLISWLVPSFSQHNLHLVVSGRCLHVPVTKFQDKFASLRQVNNPYS